MKQITYFDLLVAAKHYLVKFLSQCGIEKIKEIPKDGCDTQEIVVSSCFLVKKQRLCTGGFTQFLLNLFGIRMLSEKWQLGKPSKKFSGKPDLITPEDSSLISMTNFIVTNICGSFYSTIPEQWKTYSFFAMFSSHGEISLVSSILIVFLLVVHNSVYLQHQKSILN